VPAASLKVAGSVVDQHCGRGHSLDRVYMTAETPEERRATVTRMEQLRSRLKKVQYHVALSQSHTEGSGPRGHVGREFIENTVRDISSAEFFLCGSPPFMEASRGIKPEHIKWDSLGSAVPKSAQPNVLASETSVVVELEAAEEHGVGISSSYRRGQCGTCKTKLMEGNVRMDAEEGLDRRFERRDLC
jgi:ferredoxin-NADP reductase